jgi:hypothetical protein
MTGKDHHRAKSYGAHDYSTHIVTFAKKNAVAAAAGQEDNDGHHHGAIVLHITERLEDHSVPAQHLLLDEKVWTTNNENIMNVIKTRHPRTGGLLTAMGGCFDISSTPSANNTVEIVQITVLPANNPVAVNSPTTPATKLKVGDILLCPPTSATHLIWKAATIQDAVATRLKAIQEIKRFHIVYFAQPPDDQQEADETTTTKPTTTRYDYQQQHHCYYSSYPRPAPSPHHHHSAPDSPKDQWMTNMNGKMAAVTTTLANVAKTPPPPPAKKTITTDIQVRLHHTLPNGWKIFQCQRSFRKQQFL